MTSHAFTVMIQSHGLWKKNLGLDSLAALETLIQHPVPMVKGKGKERGKTPSSVKCLSLVIGAGFAQLNREAGHYEITEAGRQWHGHVSRLMSKQKQS